MVQLNIAGKLLVLETAFRYEDREAQAAAQCVGDPSCLYQDQGESTRTWNPARTIVGKAYNVMSSVSTFVRGDKKRGRFIVLTNNSESDDEEYSCNIPNNTTNEWNNGGMGEGITPNACSSSTGAQDNQRHQQCSSSSNSEGDQVGFYVRSSEGPGRTVFRPEAFTAKQSRTVAVSELIPTSKVEQCMNYMPRMGAGDIGDLMSNEKEEQGNKHCSS